VFDCQQAKGVSKRTLPASRRSETISVEYLLALDRRGLGADQRRHDAEQNGERRSQAAAAKR